VSLDPEKCNPPEVRVVVTQALILELYVKAVATPPPDYLAQCMKVWSHEDRQSLIDKMQGLYTARIAKLRESGLWDLLDGKERALLQADPMQLTMQQVVDANWLGESIVCLLWAVGYIGEIPKYDHQVARGIMKQFPKDPSNVPKLRPSADIERQRQIAETWHWRSRTRQLLQSGGMPNQLPGGMTLEQMLEKVSAKASEAGDFESPISGDFPAFGKPYRDLTPKEFSITTSIAMERHRALNWLCGWAPNNRWADTPTDT